MFPPAPPSAQPRIIRLRLNDFRAYAKLDVATPAALAGCH
jgi:hypothetical protein